MKGADQGKRHEAYSILDKIGRARPSRGWRWSNCSVPRPTKSCQTRPVSSVE
ncbi:hypothetical protein FTUN_8143 [Frigoriglobus tundricola]|uniref:Uncharacterized protein n=1 Tax=Frigoriglobus tundricola TaxID=2774151 RepID=A0A6M5Z5H4_9BACT|nr:hypothetical protein FTUN_8143 [Frigoriglobus tundricola]